ncbi:MAG TPA: iron chelate uptake ABC transporter family permease subunit [Candidatus Methanomethylophilaceae archaeon]|nr:iron chelate uptake ABC transporter family permease subunit [Candidatus Methanomethylophilaceae archaeon]
MKKNTLITIIILSLLLTSASLLSINDESFAATDENFVLIDFGNGKTEWVSIDASQETLSGLLEAAVEEIGSTYKVIGTNTISIDEISEKTLPVEVSWRYYIWSGSEWNDSTTSFNGAADAIENSVALGYYPEGVVPTETPTHKTSWTSVRGNSELDGHQTAEISGENVPKWENTYGKGSFVNSAVLVAGDKVFVNSGGTPGASTKSISPTLYCYNLLDGEEMWKYKYDVGAGFETATGVIVGNFIYLPASNDDIYKIPLEGPKTDPITNISNVKKVTFSESHVIKGAKIGSGTASISYNSGALYFGTSHGYVYCTDLDLNVKWKTSIEGSIYFNAPTVQDGKLFIGDWYGCLYVLDVSDGSIICSEKVEVVEGVVGDTGYVSNILKIDDTLIFSYADGKGMNTARGGIAVYKFDGSSLSKIKQESGFGLSSNFLTKSGSDFKGAYSFTSEGLVKIYLKGSCQLINSNIKGVKAPAVLVNDKFLIFSEYDKGGYMYKAGKDGVLLGQYKQPISVEQYVMSPPVIIDNWIFSGTDGGMYSFSGDFLSIPVPMDSKSNIFSWIFTILSIILVAFIIYGIYIKRVLKVPPVAYLRGKYSEKYGTASDGRSKVKRNKRRLAWVLVLGTIASVIMFMLCLAYGPSGNYSLSETYNLLSSAISKGGKGLTGDEVIVFVSRLPRALGTFAVGVGLSIAGVVYQAIIRNPLVDPYIMGVSAGAGTFAIASISAGFTFFGLFSSVSYSLPLAAMAGGLLAFGITMLVAEKAGGSATSYVLGGVIVGMVFGAIQTILLYSAGDKVHSAMTWLFGSFTSIDWGNIWLVLIPALALSMIPLIWAKEFNLVLLGEDQAQEMGLDVKNFNRAMLILASVLASVCVAFVGIIGFVGLVVPHLCRMIMGGDHRLVMPGSIVLGGLLLMAADFAAKMLIAPVELPVGAITTMIAAPVFIYLIIKKGRMYGD